MRTCAACGAANGEGAMFCGACGSTLARTCERCGADLPEGVRFCPRCGEAVVEVPAADRERKLVTVLFADVSGSTGLGERLDPEGLKEVMDAFFAAMRHEIEAEGGTVEKLIGDAVVGVFGVPAAHEDDATRALRAATRMRSALDRLNVELAAEHDVRLAMRIGVNSGEVVAVTHPRPGEGMVTGDAVNVAARLEQVAEPGTVLVSERTARAARGFQFRELGPRQLRGKNLPIHTLELEGEDEMARPSDVRVAAPMVGRDREMALLQTLYDRVASEGRPHLVTIYGDPGVGKSRLVEEFGMWAGDAVPPATMLRGRCLPYGEGVTFWPLSEILKGWAGVLDTDPPEEAIHKIRRACSGVVTEALAQDPAATVAALCFTVGLEDPDHPLGGIDPHHVRSAVQAAWRSFFSALAAAGPVVVLINDIHWADGAMLDLLEELADREEGPVLFVCPARPELAGRRSGWGGGRWNFSSVLLEPLSERDCRAMLDALLPDEDVPEPVRSRILERAGGNPFFLEEIVGRLVDEGRTPGAEPGWWSVPDGEVELPDTVQGVLAARIDLLSPSEKRVLQQAAVVGRVFWTGPVERLMDLGPDEVEAALRRLEGRGLVLARLGSTVAAEREFVFKHVLTRDVAYESLPRRDRAAAHAAVAAWIEESAGGRQAEFAELLAHHYAEAFEGMRFDRRGEPEEVRALQERAVRYNLVASDAARAKLALSQAERMAERALDLAATDRERGDALEALGRAAYLDYQGDLAWTSLREAMDLRSTLEGEVSDDMGDLAITALEVATRGRGMMRTLLSRSEVEPYLRVASERVREDDDQMRARLMAVRAFWPFSFRGPPPDQAEVAEAASVGMAAAELARGLGRADLESATLDAVGTRYLVRGMYGHMDWIVARRLELAERLDDPWAAGDAFAVGAWCAYHIGRYWHALDLADQGYKRSVGAPPMVLHCLDWRAQARARLGDWAHFFVDAGLAEELLGDRRETPPGFAADHVAAAAFVHEVQGDRTSADRYLQIVKWLEEAEARSSPGWAAWVSGVLARRGRFDEARARLDAPKFAEAGHGRGLLLEARCDLVAAEGAWDRAGEVVSKARAHALEAGLLALPVFADRLEALAELAGGRRADGIGLLRRAAAGFGGLGAKWEEARSRLMLARALAGASRPGDAQVELSKAVPVFERTRSVAELAQGESLAASLPGGRPA